MMHYSKTLLCQKECLPYFNPFTMLYQINNCCAFEYLPVIHCYNTYPWVINPQVFICQNFTIFVLANKFRTLGNKSLAMIRVYTTVKLKQQVPIMYNDVYH